MISDIQRLTHRGATMRTSLRCAIGIDAHEERASFPAHPFQQVEKRSERSINTIKAKHSPIQSNRVEVFSKNGFCLVAELMSGLEMEVFAGVGNVMMQSSDLDLSFFPICRTLLFTTCSTLQQFQLAMLRLEKLGAFKKAAIRYRCKSFQSEIDSNGSAMKGDIGNRHIRLNQNHHIPLRSTRLRQYPNLFDCEPIGNGTRQTHGDFPNLGQIDDVSIDGIGFELWKHKRLELSNFLESRESMPPFLKGFPSIVQASNRRLQHLRVDVLDICPRLFEFGQIVLLAMIGRKRNISGNNIFPLDGTPIRQTLTRKSPVLQFTQRTIVNLARRFEPFEHCCRLVKVWINAVGVVHCQHMTILPRLIADGRRLPKKRLGLAPRRYPSPPCRRMGNSARKVKIELLLL